MAVSDARLVRRPVTNASRAAGISVALVLMIIVLRGGVFPAGVSVLLVLAAFLLWRLPRLVGPVFFYDLIRTTRRGRYALVRTLYAIVLMALVLVVLDRWLTYIQWASRPNWSELANGLFAVLVLAQFVAVTLFTPAYTIGALVDEKDRRTIEYLLATDLTSDEIIFGKLFSRLANMFLLLLTGIPVLSLLQLLGGVDPLFVLFAVAATGVLLVSVASISLLCSLYARRSATAILGIYLALVAYMIVLPMLRPLMGRGSTLDWLNIGNPFISLEQAVQRAGSGQSLAGVFLEALAYFAAFHGTIAAICLIWAILRLRAIVLEPVGRRQSGGRHRRRSRQLFGPPMLWKEMYCRSKKERQMRLLLLLLTVGTLALGAWLYFDRAFADVAPYYIFGIYGSRSFVINAWMRNAGTLLSCLLLLAIALRASVTVTREREKQTFDDLVTTMLSTHEIAASKWLASLLSVRYLSLWLLAIWTFGAVGGGLSWVSLGALSVALFVYAAACASVGLWASAITRTSAQAQIAALGAIVALTLWHFLLLPVTMPLHSPIYSRPSAADDFEKFALIALTPPYTMTCLAFHDGDFYYTVQSQCMMWRWRWDTPVAEFASMVGLGLAIWGTFGIAFYWLAYRSLRRRRGNVG